MIYRRQFLVAVVGAPVVVGLGSRVMGHKEAAAAVPAVEPPEHYTYKGHDVTVTYTTDMAHVVIDKKKMVHLERPGPGRFVSHLLPFKEYRVSRKLVENLIDSESAGLFRL
jgi:hypothetical protein